MTGHWLASPFTYETDCCLQVILARGTVKNSGERLFVPAISDFEKKSYWLPLSDKVARMYYEASMTSIYYILQVSLSVPFRLRASLLLPSVTPHNDAVRPVLGAVLCEGFGGCGTDEGFLA